jgi:PilZ domain
MSSKPISDESRRSTRVPLKVLIEVQDGAECLTAETIIVNLHGALISTSTELNAGMTISIYVYLTDKRARAQVVYVDPENPVRCGIELDKPQNIWGVPLPPDDWEEARSFRFT